MRLESINKMLTEELNHIKSTNENLNKTLEDSKNQNKVHNIIPIMFIFLAQMKSCFV